MAESEEYMATVRSAEELPNGVRPFERWVRLPNRPGERLQGLSRATVYSLIQAGKIKTANIRSPGKLTGIRLIWEQSLVDYIEAHVESGVQS
jgi:predicted DNA-binding transcriptional regulator AlpA